MIWSRPTLFSRKTVNCRTRVGSKPAPFSVCGGRTSSMESTAIARSVSIHTRKRGAGGSLDPAHGQRKKATARANATRPADWRASWDDCTGLATSSVRGPDDAAELAYVTRSCRRSGPGCCRWHRTSCRSALGHWARPRAVRRGRAGEDVVTVARRRTGSTPRADVAVAVQNVLAVLVVVVGVGRASCPWPRWCSCGCRTLSSVPAGARVDVRGDGELSADACCSA